jgi:hypothetical protein
MKVILPLPRGRWALARRGLFGASRMVIERTHNGADDRNTRLTQDIQTLPDLRVPLFGHFAMWPYGRRVGSRFV